MPLIFGPLSVVVSEDLSSFGLPPPPLFETRIAVTMPPITRTRASTPRPTASPVRLFFGAGCAQPPYDGCAPGNWAGGDWYGWAGDW